MADVTDATFETEVIERSKQVAVVVDLWAEWCGPCRQLGPIIEKVVAETNGLVELAKVDVDANPAIAQAFKVQSIPAVHALKDGQVVDGFMGAQGEDQVREFVQRLIGPVEVSEVDLLIEAGDEASLRSALELEADNPDVVTALAAILIDTDRAEEVEQVLARIPESPETRRLAALTRHGGLPDDVDDRLAQLLAEVKVDEDARQQFIDLLEVLGGDDPRTAVWRRKLSAALF